MYYSDSEDDDFVSQIHLQSIHNHSVHSIHSAGINENIMYYLKAQCIDRLNEMFFQNAF